MLTDVRRPPPSLPPAYGTFLYPSYADYLSPDKSIEQQMKSISMNRQSGEKTKFIDTKRRDYKSKRQAQAHIIKYCEVCSEYIDDNKRVTVCHTHNSSKMYSMNPPTDSWGNYSCFTCKSAPHSSKIGLRYPVVVSSSILNNWQGRRTTNDSPGDDIHVDYLSYHTGWDCAGASPCIQG